MGIRCLTRFVDQYFKGWEKSPVKGKLIIDGYALFHCLFEEYSTTQNELFGGDYVSIMREISKFLQTMIEFKINPLIVLDGTIDGAKSETISSRAQNKVNDIVDQLQGLSVSSLPAGSKLQFGMNKQHLTPYLSTDAIVDAVTQILGADRLFVADTDADIDVACLAIHHQCPVLSSDSDFYVFPLPYGYIPYSRFHWRNPNGNIVGELYSYQLFCRQFGICDASLLTIIPVIVGNDTINPLDTKCLKELMPRDAHVYSGRLIENTIKYVASFVTFESCLRSLRKQKFFSIIENIQQAYFDYFFLPLFQPRTSSITIARCKDGSQIPDFIMKKYRKGHLHPFVLDIIEIHATCFNVALEDMLSESWCCLIGVPIRKATYGILCGSDTCIEEYQRCECSIDYETVERIGIGHITYNGTQILLPTLQSCGLELDKEYGKKILFGILDTLEENFENIPKNYQLLLATTQYWYRHCTITNKDILLESFVLLIQLLNEHIIERYLPKRVLYNPADPLFPIASFTHAFAQWQSLYRDIQCLNELLQKPLELLRVSCFLECSFLYYLVEAVMKRGVSYMIKQFCLSRDTHQIYYAAINPEPPVD